MHKFTIFLSFLLLSCGIQAQEFKKRHIRTLEDFGIDYDRLITEDEAYTAQFENILEKDRKRKWNKTLGYILGGLGVLKTTVGVMMLAADSEGSPVGRYAVGGFLAGLGTIEMGISVPLFLSSKKRKKERNELIREFNPDFGE